MNHSHRTDLIDAMTALAERYPHWRFGQLVANVAGWADAEIWDVEDEQLLSAATAHLERSPGRAADPSVVENAAAR